VISLPSFGSGETKVRCPQHAVLGWDADRRLREGAGPVEFLTDPAVPPIPPMPAGTSSKRRWSPSCAVTPTASTVIKEGVKSKIQEFLPGTKHRRDDEG
jgi:pyruvate dehydrogenase (quinone)